MKAAEQDSLWECRGFLEVLYYAMHPDAQALIPMYVIESWYTEDFRPLRPEPAISTGVRFIPWTWPVNGVTYPNTAEVTFVQRFGDGTVLEDVVRLVWEGGGWRWFFGRSAEFVQQQIDRFRPQFIPEQQGVVSFGLDAVVDQPAEILFALPPQIGIGVHVSPPRYTTDRPSYADSTMLAIYADLHNPFVTGAAAIDSLRAGISVSEAIAERTDRAARSYGFRVLAWNLAPANNVPYAHFLAEGSREGGIPEFVVWGDGDGQSLLTISALQRDDLLVMASTLIEAAQSPA